jgi:Uma2 family endonuclease
VPEGWLVRVQQPLTLGNSQPEPDIAVVQKTLDAYASAPPQATDAALVVEAAEASLLTDRRLKARIYSRAGILNYWLLNLLDGQLEVFTNPSGPVQMPGYQEHRAYRIEDRISLVIGLNDLGTIRIGDLIP